MADQTEPAPGRRQVLQVLAGSVGAGLAVPALATGGSSHAPPTGGRDRRRGHRGASRIPRREPARDARLARRGDRARLPRGRGRGVRRPAARDRHAGTADGLPGGARRAAGGVALALRQALAVARRGPEDRAADRRDHGTQLAHDPLLDARSSGVRRAGPPTLRDRFDLVKQRVATAYYSSEQGMKELGWTGQMVQARLAGLHPPGRARVLGRGARQFARIRFCASWQELQALPVTGAVMARAAPEVPVTSV